VVVFVAKLNGPTLNSPSTDESENRVLPFRPRNGLAARKAPPPPLLDLDKYERAPEEPDDFRHRMLMNALGLAVTVVLIGGGLWIAEVMAHMRKDQDCALTGRSNCMPIEVPQR